MRAKVYGGCTATIVCGPFVVFCAPTCYIIAAPILEVEITQYKREVDAFVKEFNKFADSFTTFSTMAADAEKVAVTWYYKISDFKDEIEVQYEFINGMNGTLYLKKELRTMVTTNLETLITECDKVIDDTSG